MSQSHNFRSALGGFNREDVVRYIEYINSKNTSAVNQLKSENQSLKDELNALRANQSAPVEPAEDLRPELDAALAKIAELEAQIAELTAQREAADLAGQELEAYRRAERMERIARERCFCISHIICFHKVANSLCYHFSAVNRYDFSVKIFLVISSSFNFITIYIFCSDRWQPTKLVNV